MALVRTMGPHSTSLRGSLYETAPKALGPETFPLDQVNGSEGTWG